MITIENKVIREIRDYFHREKFIDKDSVTKKRKEFFETLKKRHLIKTRDESYTINSEEIPGKKEAMHDINGGFIEAYEKFFLPCEVMPGYRILDLCSGLGYNATCALHYAKDLKIQMIEFCPEVLALSLIIEVPKKYKRAYGALRSAIEDKLFSINFLKHKMSKGKKRGEVKIAIGDVRKTIECLPKEYYDAVFFDPYSPEISPELYTIEFLSKIREKMKDNAILSSYSSSFGFRSSLIEAGFRSVGMKRTRKEGTIASKGIRDYNLAKTHERLIALSDLGIPFRGTDLEKGSIILERRKAERLRVRNKVLLSSTKRSPLYLDKDWNTLSKRILREYKAIALNEGISKYIICPQYNHCICNKCSNRGWRNSVERILEMRDRMLKFRYNTKSI